MLFRRGNQFLVRPGLALSASKRVTPTQIISSAPLSPLVFWRALQHSGRSGAKIKTIMHRSPERARPRPIVEEPRKLVGEYLGAHLSLSFLQTPRNPRGGLRAIRLFGRLWGREDDYIKLRIGRHRFATLTHADLFELEDHRVQWQIQTHWGIFCLTREPLTAPCMVSRGSHSQAGAFLVEKSTVIKLPSQMGHGTKNKCFPAQQFNPCPPRP